MKIFLEKSKKIPIPGVFKVFSNASQSSQENVIQSLKSVTVFEFRF